MTWEAVIGLEVHARLLTRTKIFCACPTDFGAPPNTHVCPVCLGYPGALPVLNRTAVELAMRAALATGCTVHERSIFARKNYFYPDLPKGYQISQFDQPLATGGAIGNVRIRRIHMEEDAGKLIHHGEVSHVDLNRAGTPLIEVVSEPDIRSAEEADAYLTRLRQIVMYAEVCDGNMEEGSMRCDANVSIRRPGAELGTRTEIKNLNSFRYLRSAIDFEIARQTAVLDSGGVITQETRLYDTERGETRPMRSKEEAHDYRYFPDPDLLPLVLDPAWIEELRAQLPELPDAKKARFVTEYGLRPEDAGVLVAERATAEYFERVARGRDPKQAANWVMGDLFGALNRMGVGLAEIGRYPVNANQLGRLIDLIADHTISGRIAKDVFQVMLQTPGHPDPAAIVEQRGLQQVTNTGAIEAAVDAALAANPG